MVKKKENRGGSGRGQGRRLKYGEETVKVNYRVPVSWVAWYRYRTAGGQRLHLLGRARACARS